MLTARNIIWAHTKNLVATLYVDFSKSFDSVQRRKMMQIKLVHILLKEIHTTKMMLYKNTKAMGHFHDGNPNFFEIYSAVFLVGWLVGFYGISTIVIYLMPNLLHTNKQFCFKQLNLV